MGLEFNHHHQQQSNGMLIVFLLGLLDQLFNRNCWSLSRIIPHYNSPSKNVNQTTPTKLLTSY